MKNKDKIFSIAPMMDWTDTHCRYFHRLLTRHALLFTEMVTTGAVIHGDRDHLLGYNDAEHPVAVQLGGADPAELAQAAQICADFGYDEINLNVGCPSDRVQSGRFGACLMAEPNLVAACVDAMKNAVSLPVTVKCRIGIDDQDSEKDFEIFTDQVIAAGTDALYVHARKAWLQGLSPKQNRDIPPLDYDRVYRLKNRHPDVPVILNGGLETLEDCIEPLIKLDGVMLGRAPYHNAAMLADVDRTVYGDTAVSPNLHQIITEMAAYAERQMGQGVRLQQITRHMIGYAHARPGARRWRQILTVEASKPGASPDIMFAALEALSPQDISA